MTTHSFQVKWLGDAEAVWEPETTFDSDPILSAVCQQFKRDKQINIRREKRRVRDLDNFMSLPQSYGRRCKKPAIQINPSVTSTT